MTGHFFNGFAKIAARAIALTAATLVLSAAANTSSAQDPAAPDSVRADTTNVLVLTADTTKEVKHVVKKGDTLWDLAQFYLKDPFRWPEIFRRNTEVVENPHWIYPGEIIRIWGHEVKPEALAIADSAGEVVSHVVTRPAPPPPVAGDGRDLTVFASPLSRAASEMSVAVSGRTSGRGVRRGEVEAAPYVERRGGPRGSGRVIAGVDRAAIQMNSVESRFQLNDRVYIEMPRGLVGRTGDRYLTYVMGDDIAGVGQVLVPTGIVRVESVQSGQPVLARIIRQFAEVSIDQRLIPFSDAVLPTTTLMPVAGGMRGKVLYVHNQPVLPSIGHYVVLSPSGRSGVNVGDEFSFVEASTGREDKTPAPPVVVGVAQVVRVTPQAVTAIIIQQSQPTIREGVGVRLTAKVQ